GTRPSLEVAYAAPAGEVEERLAEVWRQVLGLDRVGRHDNFFDLGGDSIRATQMVARVRAALKIEVPLNALFEAPTLLAFASRVVHAIDGDAPSRPLAPRPLAPRDRHAPLPLSDPQRRLWFLDRSGRAAPRIAPHHLRRRGRRAAAGDSRSTPRSPADR
ncbi:MAG: hypothetical protein E6K80_05855, partial [Candidatus Eisenbacteria bacterium]